MRMTDSVVGPTNHFCHFLPISPLGMILPSSPVCSALSLQLNKPLGPGIGGLCSQYVCIASVVSTQPLLPSLSWPLLPLRPAPPCSSLCMDLLGKILQDGASPGRPWCRAPGRWSLCGIRSVRGSCSWVGELTSIFLGGCVGSSGTEGECKHTPQVLVILHMKELHPALSISKLSLVLFLDVFFAVYFTSIAVIIHLKQTTS